MQDPGLKMRDTIALASVLTLKSDWDLPLASYHSQSNLKSPQTLATTKNLTHFIISMASVHKFPAVKTGCQGKVQLFKYALFRFFPFPFAPNVSFPAL
jgi:hypothetical protein